MSLVVLCSTLAFVGAFQMSDIDRFVENVREPNSDPGLVKGQYVIPTAAKVFQTGMIYMHMEEEKVD